MNVRLSGPRCFLTSILLVTSLVLPALAQDSLLCYFCPLQRKDMPCPRIMTQCPPDQYCTISRGHHGSTHMLSAQGCVDRELCGSHEMKKYMGVEYNVTYTCCCKDKCNWAPKFGLKKLLLILTKMYNDTSAYDLLQEESWDSCANYTASKTTATKS